MTSPPGQVFTPPAFADHLWRATYHAWRNGGGQGSPTVVEPAAGDGALLSAIQRSGSPADITAIELDPTLLAGLEDLADASPAGQTLTVVHADTLGLARGAAGQPSPIAPLLGLTPPPAPAYLHDTGWADIVIANPPYLRETGNAPLFRALRAWNDNAFAPLYRKDADLHHFFWDIALRWLRPGGVLAFLTPAYFLESESAAPLRQRLARDGEILGIYRAQDVHIFAAGVEAAVTLLRKGPRDDVPRTTHRLSADLVPRGPAIPLPADGSPWWLDQAPELLDLGRLPLRLSDLYRVREGVSTGANKLRSKDVTLIPGAQIGDGILVLSPEEATALACSRTKQFLRIRHSTNGRHQSYILRLFDGDLPNLDAGHPPTTKLEHHLSRFRPILEKRAEIQRNPSRSWYALAWPRPELGAPGALVTPKWSKAPAFAPMTDDRLPMTDFRVLVPRTPEVAANRDRILAWLLSPTIAPWYAHRLKKKGAMTEWYGNPLDDIPVPALSNLEAR